MNNEISPAQKYMRANLRDRNLWSKPEEYDLSQDLDRKIWDKKFDNNQVNFIHDRLDLIADDLFSILLPNKKEDFGLRQEYKEDILGQGMEYGKWFYFPWSKEMVHYPDKVELRMLRTARNKELIDEHEQSLLYASTIAIFGLSVGSNVVDELVISGIGGKLILADPDIIDPTNLNRIHGSFSNVGSKKVDHVARKISEVDPYIEQVHISEKVTRDVLSEIVEEHKPNIMIDEVDDFSAKVAIRDRARIGRVAVIMATDLGDKALIDVERHDLERTKPFNGKLKQDEFDSMLLTNDPEKAKKLLPKIIGIRNVSPRMLNSFMEVDKSLAGIPQLGITATNGGSLAALASREIILGRRLNSGRYVKNTLKLKSPTSFSHNIKIFKKFINSSKH